MGSTAAVLWITLLMTEWYLIGKAHPSVACGSAATCPFVSRQVAAFANSESILIAFGKAT